MMNAQVRYEQLRDVHLKTQTPPMANSMQASVPIILTIYNWGLTVKLSES